MLFACDNYHLNGRRRFLFINHQRSLIGCEWIFVEYNSETWKRHATSTKQKKKIQIFVHFVSLLCM